MSGNRHQTGAHHCHLVLKAEFLNGPAGTRNRRHGTSLDAPQVRILSKCPFYFLIRDFLIIIIKDFVRCQPHFRIFLLLPPNRGVCPLIVGFGQQARHSDQIVAFSPHIFCEMIHEMGAISSVVKGLNVIVHVLLVDSLMRDHHDPLVHRVFQCRLQHLGRKRDHTYRIHPFVGQFFDKFCLFCRQRFCRSEKQGFMPGIPAEPLYSLSHALKPGMTDGLDHNSDGLFFGKDLSCISGCENECQCHDQKFFHKPSIIVDTFI